MRRNNYLKFIWLCLIPLMITVCSQGSLPPIEVQIVSIDPPPVVGQVSTVTFHVTSGHHTIADALINTYLHESSASSPPPQTVWRGELVGDETYWFAWDMCIPKASIWELWISARPFGQPYLGGDTKYIHADVDAVKVRDLPIRPEVTPRTIIVSGTNRAIIRYEIGTPTPAIPEPMPPLSSECLETHSFTLEEK